MKRTELHRKTPLRSYSQLQPGCGLTRSGPVKPVSDKRAKLNRQRTEVLRPIREAQQWCARCGRTGWGLDAHELVRRSQYAAGVVDENVIVLLCRECHEWVTVNPEAAHAAGWTLWGWEHRQGAAS